MSVENNKDFSGFDKEVHPELEFSGFDIIVNNFVTPVEEPVMVKNDFLEVDLDNYYVTDEPKHFVRNKKDRKKFEKLKQSNKRWWNR